MQHLHLILIHYDDNNLQRVIPVSLNGNVLAPPKPQSLTFNEILPNVRNVDTIPLKHFGHKKHDVINFSIQSFISTIVNDTSISFRTWNPLSKKVWKPREHRKMLVYYIILNCRLYQFHLSYLLISFDRNTVSYCEVKHVYVTVTYTFDNSFSNSFTWRLFLITKIVCILSFIANEICSNVGHDSLHQCPLSSTFFQMMILCRIHPYHYYYFPILRVVYYNHKKIYLYLQG